MSHVTVSKALDNWRNWSTGSVDELAAIGTAFLWALGLEPLAETSASASITRRTIRYYISQGVLNPPVGERRLASYDYRHLLQLLFIKARQHAGDRLEQIRAELDEVTESKLEALVLDALPASVPPPVPDEPSEFARPARLEAVLNRWAYLTGRQGRYQDQQVSPLAAPAYPAEAGRARETDIVQVRHAIHLRIDEEVELTIPADHPLVHDHEARSQIVRSIRRTLRRYIDGHGPV
jgi:DNA-binding transcriptional MerR regulator